MNLHLFKLLIVDDENMVRLGFEKLIKWENYGIELCSSCSNGQEALDYILNNDIDILITDIKMPIMTGIELLTELSSRKMLPTVTLVLSAFDEYQLIRNCFKLNIDDYLLKSNYDESSVATSILNILNDKLGEKSKANDTQTYSYEISKVLDFLNKNYHNTITLKTLSSSVNYSEAYLSHLFSNELGVTITEYLTNLRVEKAKILLDTTSFKVYEIAIKVGFQNTEHFSRSFKKYAGISPKKYKQTSSDSGSFHVTI